MAAEIIDGRALAQQILEGLKGKIANLPNPPVLAIVLVGDNPASLAFIAQKQKSANYIIGSGAQLFQFDEKIDQQTLIQGIKDIENGSRGAWETFLINDVGNEVTKPDAIIVQRPLPAHITDEDVITAVSPEKDVDGFHPDSPFAPPVAEAVVEIITSVLKGPGSNLKSLIGSRQVCLVGYGRTAGKPIANLLEKQGIIPTVIRSKTENPKELARTADILIVAVGKPGFITRDWVKPDALVIDVGTNRLTDPVTQKTKLRGDCDESVAQVAGFLTPVPGGVGPVNVACLMKNVVESFWSNKPGSS